MVTSIFKVYGISGDILVECFLCAHPYSRQWRRYNKSTVVRMIVIGQACCKFITEDLLLARHVLLEKEMATHSSVLAWRIQGTGEPGGLPSMGLHRVGCD